MESQAQEDRFARGRRVNCGWGEYSGEAMLWFGNVGVSVAEMDQERGAFAVVQRE